MNILSKNRIVFSTLFTAAFILIFSIFIQLSSVPIASASGNHDSQNHAEHISTTTIIQANCATACGQVIQVSTQIRIDNQSVSSREDRSEHTENGSQNPADNNELQFASNALKTDGSKVPKTVKLYKLAEVYRI